MAYSAIIFTISFFGILGGISFLLHYSKADSSYIIAFFFHGSIYLSSSVWESAIWGFPRTYYTLPYFSLSLWLLLYGVIGVSFMVQYINKEGFDRDKFVIFGGLLIGNWMFFGVLEDFGCFLIWGVADTFNPTYAYWHHDWFFNIVPLFYLIAIPGIILIITSLWFSINLDVKIAKFQKRFPKLYNKK